MRGKLCKKNEQGFTLVEIAIVLVIVGLLIGAVLQGYELTTNAKIKALINDFEGVRAAHYSYIDRKSVFAGEDANTGKIISSVASADSNSDFFGELALEGFIKNQNITPPKGAATAYEVYYVADQAVADTNNATIPGENQFCATEVDGVAARSLDLKLDDGVPDEGRLRAETSVDAIETEYEKGVKVTVCLAL